MAIRISDYERLDTGIYRFKSDKTKWMLRTRVNGKQVARTYINTEANIKTAKLHASQMMLKFIKEKSDTTDLHSVKHHFDKWRGNKTSWGKAYSNTIRIAFNKHIADYIGKKPIRHVVPVDIDEIMSQPNSKRVRKTITEILIPLFKYALDREFIDKSPILDSHRITRDSVGEKRKVTNAAEKYKRLHQVIMELEPRDRSLMLLGFHGRRKTEALSLKWEDIFEDTYIVRKESNKVDEDMVYTLPSDVKQALEEWKPKTNGTGYIFDSPKKPGTHMTDIRDIVYGARDKAGIPELTYHWMRNLAVTALSQQGVSTVDLSAMLGHTDLNTLQKYLSIERESSTQRTAEAAMNFLKEKK